jgi:Ca-activated chloride channel family protein
MSFVSPLFLLALLAVPAVVVFALAMGRRRARYAVAFTNLELLAGVVEERRRSWRRWLPVALFLFALATAAGALARPRLHLSVPQENATVVLLVDVSGSMRANDVEPSRLDAALGAMSTFLDRVPKRLKVGLVQFSSEPDILVQPTANRETVRDALAYLEPQAGTAIGDGLETAVKLIRRSFVAAGASRQPGRDLPAAIVLLSDGAQNRGVLQPLQAAAHARTAGIRVYTISLGTAKGVVKFGSGAYTNSIPVPPDPATMRAIARATGGRDFSARDAQQANGVFGKLGSSIGWKSEKREITSWFALAAAVLLLMAVGLARGLQPRLP